MDIDHFHEHVNSLTTELAAHGIIIPYVLKNYKA